jgi:anti-anti-sigma factor
MTMVHLLESHLLDSHGLDETYGQLLEAADLGTHSQVVLDFSAVSSISAAGLRRLVAFERKLSARGGELALRNVGDHVYQVFVVTRLAGHFGLRDGRGRRLTSASGLA